jgi:inosose dehydratase
MKTRRQFLKLTGASMIAAGAAPVLGSSVYRPEQETTTESDSFTLGMAGYTFVRFNVEDTIKMMKRVAVSNISLKDFHMPLNSTREQITEVIDKFSNEDIKVYTVGVVYMRTPESVDQAFEYARMAGVDMIVGAPNYELLTYVGGKVQEYDIKVAIHNHGPDNPLFPNATDIWEHVKDLDPRLGLCLDIGHNIRDGHDPVADIEKYGERIYDLHLKDVDKASKEGRSVELGRGIIDIPAVVESLRKINYTGKCSLEFEKDMDDPLAGIAESIGYFRGVLDCK